MLFFLSEKDLAPLSPSPDLMCMEVNGATRASIWSRWLSDYMQQLSRLLIASTNNLFPMMEDYPVRHFPGLSAVHGGFKIYILFSVMRSRIGFHLVSGWEMPLLNLAVPWGRSSKGSSTDSVPFMLWTNPWTSSVFTGT